MYSEFRNVDAMKIFSSRRGAGSDGRRTGTGLDDQIAHASMRKKTARKTRTGLGWRYRRRNERERSAIVTVRMSHSSPSQRQGGGFFCRSYAVESGVKVK